MEKPITGIVINCSYEAGQSLSLIKGGNLQTGLSIFRKPPYTLHGNSSINMTEYIALLMAAWYRYQRNPDDIIYSNNDAAIKWFLSGEVKSKIELGSEVEKVKKEFESKIERKMRTGVEKWRKEWGAIPV
ncbi:hypothetical protein [Parvicella tangerina]|uniref:Uncharacterized protein n=1 Tax=Parvicella tangerina TaxID=2829795 RepID=A0A916JKU6_9FLAO|nr:hypothetical protein [Parvicella tangerina]CAG5077544.1 hypothetical protein CRYO30217_00420 [Parvicella tangerina]